MNSHRWQVATALQCSMTVNQASSSVLSIYYLTWASQWPVILVLFIPPFYRWGIWAVKGVSDLPRVWVLINYGSRTHTHITLLPRIRDSILPPTHNAGPGTKQSHAGENDRLQGRSGNFMGMSKTMSVSGPPWWIPSASNGCHPLTRWVPH